MTEVRKHIRIQRGKRVQVRRHQRDVAAGNSRSAAALAAWPAAADSPADLGQDHGDYSTWDPWADDYCITNDAEAGEYVDVADESVNNALDEMGIPDSLRNTPAMQQMIARLKHDNNPDGAVNWEA